MKEVYEQNRPKQQDIDKIERVFASIKQCLLQSDSFQEKYNAQQVSEGFKGYSLIKYGSVVNGTLSNGSSDLDTTIIVDNQILSHEKLLTSVKIVLEKYQSTKNRY